MYKTEHNKVLTELRRFNQRKLVKGELTLLAFVISSELPLLPPSETNPRGFVTGKGILIERIIYRLNEFAHVDTDQRRELIDVIVKFALWRSAVATGTKPLFTSNTETVIDELSGLTRLLDPASLCSISDVVENSNWLVRTFHDLVHMEQGILETEQSPNS